MLLNRLLGEPWEVFGSGALIGLRASGEERFEKTVYQIGRLETRLRPHFKRYRYAQMTMPSITISTF